MMILASFFITSIHAIDWFSVHAMEAHCHITDRSCSAWLIEKRDEGIAIIINQNEGGRKTKRKNNYSLLPVVLCIKNLNS